MPEDCHRAFSVLARLNPQLQMEVERLKNNYPLKISIFFPAHNPEILFLLLLSDAEEIIKIRSGRIQSE